VLALSFLSGVSGREAFLVDDDGGEGAFGGGDDDLGTA
jgi:hypothetical protein